MAIDEYKTFRVSLRTPRVTCFLDSRDSQWKLRAIAAIQAFSRTWGGCNFIFIPTDGDSISDPFWHILSSYDPDYFWTAFVTNDPGEQELQLSEKLVSKLILRLAPFHFNPTNNFIPINNRVVETACYPNFRAKYPFTDVADILDSIEHPEQLFAIRSENDLFHIWAGAAIGMVDHKWSTEIKDKGVFLDEVKFGSEANSWIDLVVSAPSRRPETTIGAFPWDLSSLGLGFSRSIEFAEHQEATIVVAGDSIDDFCLYYALSRMRRKVVWLLPEWIPNEAEISSDINYWFGNNPIAVFLRAAKDLMDRQSGGGLGIISISLMDQLDRISELIRRSPLHLDNVQTFITGDDVSSHEGKDKDDLLSECLQWLLKYPIRVMEYGNESRPIAKHVINSKVATQLEIPKPRNFSKIDPFKHLWLTEFSVDKQRFPRHPLIGIEVASSGWRSTKNSRSGNQGIVLFTPRSGSITAPIEHIIGDANVSLPSAFEIFQRLLVNVGYEPSFSDKGRYSIQTISKFGGISNLANQLLANPRLSLFLKYISPESRRLTGSESDSARDGLFLTADRRRYLHLPAIAQALGSDISASSFIYDLVNRGVLHRGVILKCELCRGTDWYGVVEMSDKFTCKRCSYVQAIGSYQSLRQIEPVWFYKLDEVVYKAFSQDFVAPILTLNYFKEKSTSFDHASELELVNVKDRKLEFELDICCIADGKLTIGEAKTDNRLGKTRAIEEKLLTKYYDLCESLGIGQVAFATTKEQWREETIRMIHSRFKRSLTKVVLLNKKDLFRLN